MQQIKQIFTEKRVELLIILALLIISGVAHAYNMFHFPYYENDEGTYMSQAWSVLTQGKLAPYTYWYDHAPAGWILIALWVKLTGGFFTFGPSVNSGRVLMLVLHLATSYLLFYVAKKLSRSNLPGIIAVLIFSLSPLGIYFQRRVLLDNIMLFWVFVSLALLLKDSLKLRHILMSAITFGIAVLTKENAIFFLPAFLYVIHRQAHSHHKRFAIVKWITVSGSVISFYLLYAILRGELFPSGTLLGGNLPHVSLIETLQFQMSRDGGSIFTPGNSAFWKYMNEWYSHDRLLIVAGTASTILTTLVSLRKKKYLGLSLLGVSFWLFLIRGGLVLEFYIIPLIPILALLIGFSLHEIIRFLKLHRNQYTYLTTAPLVILTVLTFYAKQGGAIKKGNLYTANQTKPQVQALSWLRSNVNSSSILVIDNYGYVDLQTLDDSGQRQDIHAEWYWKVDRDNAVKWGLLGNSPENIDVIAMTPQMDKDLTQGNLTLLSRAIEKAQPRKRFWQDGWGVEIWTTRFPKQTLERSWSSYKKHFINTEGMIVDPQDNVTTSEAQSYAMLRSVWMGDRETFDLVWSWTKNNLRLENGLFVWRYVDGKELDRGTATDADQDIALALLFAYQKWGDPVYLSEGSQIADSIWEQEVVVVDGVPYVAAGNWANHEDSITINSSYLSPANYRVFARVDPEHSWGKAVSSSYELLNRCSFEPLDKKQGLLPPEWCSLDKESKEVRQPEAPQPRATEYSYNAFRTPWRVALDYAWYKDPRAERYLDNLDFLHEEWIENNKLATAYQHDGQVWEDYESVAAYSGNLGYFKVVHPKLVDEVYEKKIANKFYEDDNRSYWEDPNNYYTQNWAWFGTALYSDNLPNLWNANNHSQ